MRHQAAQQTGLTQQGQTAVEFAVLVTVIIAAFLAMQVYMERGMSGRFRGAADSIGEQYAPRHTASDFTVSFSGTTVTKTQLMPKTPLVDGNGRPVLDGQGNQIRADVMKTTSSIDARDPEKTTRTGTETVGTMGTDLWSN